MTNYRIKDVPTTKHPLGSFGLTASITVASAVLLNIPAYVFSVWNGPIPLFTYLSAIILAASIALFSPISHMTLKGEPIIYILLFIIVLCVINPASMNYFYDTIFLRNRILSYLLLLSFLIIGTYTSLQSTSMLLFAAVILTGLGNWIDVILPNTIISDNYIHKIAGRGASTYLNPNQSAEAIIFMAAASVFFIKQRWRLPLLIAMLAGVFGTFSRSGFVGAMILVLYALRSNSLGRINFFIAIPIFAATIFAATSFMNDIIPILQFDTRNIQQRLGFLSGDFLVDDSTSERVYVVEQAFQMFYSSPFFGNGLGSTIIMGGGRGVHNMYILYLAEFGIIGFILYISFIFAVVLRGNLSIALGNSRKDNSYIALGRALVAVGLLIAYFSLVSHTILDDPFLLVVLGTLLGQFGSMRGFALLHGSYSSNQRINST